MGLVNHEDNKKVRGLFLAHPVVTDADNICLNNKKFICV